MMASDQQRGETVPNLETARRRVEAIEAMIAILDAAPFDTDDVITFTPKGSDEQRTLEVFDGLDDALSAWRDASRRELAGIEAQLNIARVVPA